MTQGTYKRKHLIRGSQFRRVIEPVTVMARSTVAAGQHGAGAVVENLHLILKHEAEGGWLTGNGRGILNLRAHL